MSYEETIDSIDYLVDMLDMKDYIDRRVGKFSEV